ncbi:MAG: hypothetical protein IJK81_13650 [Selenomonadaceae bacterium]|nr:hypothetical protein [Selenomonadaceae bacterium]
MKDFVRFNPVAESMLKVLVAHDCANPDNLSFALSCDKLTLGKNLRFLLEEGYVVNANPEHSGKVYPNDNYRITVAGENYLSSLKFYSTRDRRQHWINIINGAIALVALVRAFWGDIISALQR